MRRARGRGHGALQTSSIATELLPASDRLAQRTHTRGPSYRMDRRNGERCCAGKFWRTGLERNACQHTTACGTAPGSLNTERKLTLLHGLNYTPSAPPRCPDPLSRLEPRCSVTRLPGPHSEPECPVSSPHRDDTHTRQHASPCSLSTESPSTAPASHSQPFSKAIGACAPACWCAAALLRRFGSRCSSIWRRARRGH